MKKQLAALLIVALVAPAACGRSSAENSGAYMAGQKTIDRVDRYGSVLPKD